MSIAKCIAEIERVAGKLSDEDLGSLSKKVQDIIKKAEGQDGADYDKAVRQFTEELIEDMQTAAVIEKRNAMFNKRAQVELYDYITNTWGDRPDVGMKAFLGGVNAVRKGSRHSVASEQESLFNYYSTSMLADLEREGVDKFAASGKFDDEIWQALWEISSPNPNQSALKGLQPEAIKVAKILDKYNEKARMDANDSGAWIKKMPGYVTKRTHDQHKIAKAAGDLKHLDDEAHFNTWRDFVSERIDWDRTLEGAENTENTLKEMFINLASGTHIKFKDGGATGFKGFANIGKRLSHERVLHFKDAKAEFEYHERFGSGTLMENFLWGLEHMARDTTLMRHLGPNAEMNLDTVVNHVAKKIKEPSKRESFVKSAGKLKTKLWPNLTGESQIAGSALGAKVSSAARAIEQMSDLGMATLSAVADVAFYGSEVRYQGGSMLSGMAEAVTGIFHGKSGIERKEVLGELGVYIDAMRANVASRFDVADTMPGRISKANQLFFKMNFLRKWTDNQRSAFALGSSHRLAIRAEESFNQLPEGLQRVLETFGIDEGKWDIYRKGKTKEADGREYLTPEGMDELDAAPFEAYLKNKGIEPTARKVKDLKEEIKGQMRSYFFDRATTATLEPNKLTRAYLLQGTKPGTWQGEILRHVMLYKSFTASVIQKVLGREIYGYGADALPLPQQLFNVMKDPTGSSMGGLVNLMVWSTIWGYAAMSVKDIAKGREPRVPTDALSAYKTFQAAMLQGGGLGIYGDFIFGDMKNRFGGTPLTTLLGPSARRIDTIVDLFNTIKDPESPDNSVGKKAFSALINNTPFLNLFYLKWAIDYGITYRFREMMNPGYLRRMERRVKKDTDQEFIVPPSEAVK